MQLKKITTGFVIQTIDTETGTLTHQEFVAGDQCDYEDGVGNAIDPDEVFEGDEPYFPYDMVQP
jgi:hypothetical protein